MAVKNSEGINWNDPSTQVKLILTSDPEILKARRADKLSWQKEKDGREALVLRFNSREYRFRKGEALAVSAPAAYGLITSSITVADENKISGEFVAALEIVSNWTLSDREPIKAGTECPECGQVCDNARKLAKHIMDEHSEEPVVA